MSSLFKYKCPSPSASDIICKIAALIRRGSSARKCFAFTAIWSTVRNPNPWTSQSRKGSSFTIITAAGPNFSCIFETFAGVTPKGDKYIISSRMELLFWYPSRISSKRFCVIPFTWRSFSGLSLKTFSVSSPNVSTMRAAIAGPIPLIRDDDK